MERRRDYVTISRAKRIRQRVRGGEGGCQFRLQTVEVEGGVPDLRLQALDQDSPIAIRVEGLQTEVRHSTFDLDCL